MFTSLQVDLSMSIPLGASMEASRAGNHRPNLLLETQQQSRCFSDYYERPLYE